MLKPEMLQRACNYLVEHPDELVRIVRNLVGLRFGVPLAALRWVASQATGRRAPTDVVIEAVPPGIRVAATLDLMGARVRAGALIFVEKIAIDSEQLRMELRLADVVLELLEKSESPLAALIQSGALDLSKVGNLVAVMPRRPAFLVEASGERIVIDLKRHPALSGQRVDRILSLITPLVTVTSVETDLDHLDIAIGVLSRGVAGAVASWRSAL
jgi:hypothetical protein